MDLISGDIKIPQDGYLWLVNGRQRFGDIEPIYKHLTISNAPSGKKQGLIAVGSILIIFVAGKAYYRTEGSTSWLEVPGFSMDTIADRYWAQAVPASTFNFLRKLPTGSNLQDAIIADGNFTVSNTQAGIVVQDNVTQPFVIFIDETTGTLTSRQTKTYADWSNASVYGNDREYVPIGKQMMFLNEILFVVSRDGKKIYRSVTGRPLDFMVNVDTNGHKAPTETEGGANSVSFAFDSDTITCIKPVNIPNSFVYATKYITRILECDYINTIFGEPRFKTSAIIDAGVINQDSFQEILGDYAFIDVETVKSFNAVQQLQSEGRNSIFSLNISALLKDIKQYRSNSVVFDDYALFNIDTVWGNLIAVFDTLLNKWVSLDLTNLAFVKQFAITNTTSESKLYAITEGNVLYQVFGDTTARQLAQLHTRSFTPESFNVEHKSERFRPLFNSGTEDGEMTLIERIDGRQSSRLTYDIEAVNSGVQYPVRPPVIPHILSQVENPGIVIKDGLVGKKADFIVLWDTSAQLQGFEVVTTDVPADLSRKQSNNIVAS